MVKLTINTKTINMYQKISHTDEILARLLEDIPAEPVDIESIKRMNEYMEEVHNDFIYKSAMSEISAHKTVIF